MKYWAVARCLGLSDDEFNKSTLAKITAMYKVKVLHWDRTRDYFVCQLAAFTLNSHRQQQSDKVWTADDLITQAYPKLKSVIVTAQVHDCDHGAQGDWRALRSSMQGMTQGRKDKSAKRRAFKRG